MSDYMQLEAPHGLADCERAQELLRFWIGDNDDYVSLRVGVMGEQEPEQWGYVLADIARHIVNAVHQDQPSLRAEEILSRMQDGFEHRMSMKPSLAGKLEFPN